MGGKEYGDAAKKAATNKNMKEMKKQMNKKETTIVQEVKKAGEKLIIYLMKGLRNAGNFVLAAMKEFSAWIIKQIPNIVMTLLCKVIDWILPFKNVVNFVKYLKKAVENGWKMWQTWDLSKNIKSGIPKKVVESVQKQMMTDVGTAVSDAIADALVGAGKLALIGQIPDIVRDILSLIVRFFIHMKNLLKMEAVIKDVKSYCPNPVNDCNFVKDAKFFYNWFTDVIYDFPLISCYVLGNPLTGNFYGLLSGTSQKGKVLTKEELTKNFDDLTTIKQKAKSYIKDSSIEISSKNKLVSLAIDIAHGNKVEAMCAKNADDWEKFFEEHKNDPWINHLAKKGTEKVWCRGLDPCFGPGVILGDNIGEAIYVGEAKKQTKKPKKPRKPLKPEKKLKPK